MALTVGTDSYVTLTEAAEYFGRRLRSTAFDGADETTQEKALKHATLLLEAQPWAGDKTDADQTLAFPRDSDDVPQAIKDAQCELALELLTPRPVGHVLSRTTRGKDAPASPIIRPEDAEAAAHRLRGLVGPDGAPVLVLGDEEQYDARGSDYERPDLARGGATFHDLPAHVQNLIGDYVALGARLSR